MINARLVDFVHRDVGADVLVVTNMWPDEDWPVYGIFVERQVEALRSAGAACDVLYIRGHRSPLAYLVAILQFGVWNLRPPKRYRLMHVHAGETAVAARFFARVRAVVTFHGDDIMGDRRDDGSIPRVSRVRSALIRWWGALFGAVIVQSREMYVRLPRFLHSRSRVIPCGIDPELFRPTDRESARASLGLDSNAPIVLFAAIKPDRPLKRQWLAEAAIRHAATEIPNVQFLVSGETPPSRMPLLMSAADCLLHTSSFEGSPNVVREALMCNLPVVATPSGDIEELLDGVRPSWLCGADPAALGRAVIDCVREPKRSNGREVAGPSISSSSVATKILGLYSTLGRDRPLEPDAERRGPWISL